MLQGKSGNETGALGNISKVIAMSFLPFFRLESSCFVISELAHGHYMGKTTTVSGLGGFVISGNDGNRSNVWGTAGKGWNLSGL